MRIVNTSDILEEVQACPYCGDLQDGKRLCCGENHFTKAYVVGNEILFADEIILSNLEDVAQRGEK